MTKVLCDVKECIYHIFIKDEGQAYQNQCDNDEIEIERDGIGMGPICYSFRLKNIKSNKNKKILREIK